MTRRPLSSSMVAVAAALLALAGCGGDEEPADAGAPATFTGGEATFVGNAAIAWESDQIVAELADGELAATIVCEGAIPHNLVIEGVLDEEEIVACAGNDQATATVALTPGTYDFWCSVPGHRSAGMVGVLTVE